MLRRIRVLLVLALVPVIVLATPDLASAAARYGTPTTVTLVVRDEANGGQPYSEVSCAVTAYYVVDVDQGVKYRFACDTQWNAHTFDEATVDYVVFHGVTASSGAACTLADNTDQGISADDKFSGTASSGLIGPGLPNDCAVSEVCFKADDVNNNNWDNHFGPGCEPINLGAIPKVEIDPPGTGCSSGSITKPVVGADYIYDSGSDYSWRAAVSATVSQTTGAAMIYGDLPPNWEVYVVARPGTNTYGFQWFTPQYGPGVTGNVSGYSIGFARSAGEGMANNTTANVSYLQPIGDYSSSNPALSSAANVHIIGMGVFYNRWGLDGIKLHSTGTAGLRGHFGVSNPVDCSWYWGTKLYNDTGTTYDTPIGAFVQGPSTASGATTDPVPADPTAPTPEAGCNFSITDPASWASGGICALVGLIGKVISLLHSVLLGVLGVVDAIGGLVAALLDGLVGLLVPDSAALNGSVQGLQDKWDGTVIANWKDSVTGQSYAMPAAGCGGVPVDFELPGGLPVNLQLGEACSGSMANAAGIIKTVLSAGLIIYGGIACVRAIGSGFGWSPTIGKGGDPT